MSDETESAETKAGVPQQSGHHAYDGVSYKGYFVATQDQIAQLGYTSGEAPVPAPAVVLSQKCAAIKAEAARRILAICPEWKQRNLTAQAAILAEKGRSQWTAGELDAWTAGAALWAQVAAIRAASDTLEATDPIPDDITDDTHWA
ncbi:MULTISPECIES: hypothetical protein [Roseobacteraceae]|uniref:Uncharacterized protein n=1 Tax=Pseudosulfitobacter pseudonitzschiae TaxID=1402135 RepID=A0A221K0K0_9RHOB|nr:MULTISPECIES: hypothetical protein [Roseobacteraceae]ASM72501.1 hypothetical protein SULPSESMR1_01690 [Pseudosulfitobacter pseudonitzschiae]